METGILQQLMTTASAQAQATAPEWVVVWPGREPVRPSSGRGPWTVRDPQAVIAASFAAVAGGVLPVDLEHGVHRPGEGRSGKAVGWITEMRPTTAGGIEARVDWTDEGRRLVESRAYRFVSPTFNEAGGDVRDLVGLALVNTPDIHELPKVASKETAMDKDELARLRKALGLADDAAPAAIVAAAETTATSLAALTTASQQVARAAGFEALTAEVATGLAAKLKAGPVTAAVDPSQYVPIAAFTELQAQVATLTTAGQQSRVEAAIAAATEEGKLTPTLAGWARDYASKDLAGFEAWAKAAPRLVTAGAMLPKSPPVAGAGPEGLTAEEVTVASQLGLTPKQFADARSA